MLVANANSPPSVERKVFGPMTKWSLLASYLGEPIWWGENITKSSSHQSITSTFNCKEEEEEEVWDWMSLTRHKSLWKLATLKCDKSIRYLALFWARPTLSSLTYWNNNSSELSIPVQKRCWDAKVVRGQNEEWLFRGKLSPKSSQLCSPWIRCPFLTTSFAMFRNCRNVR